MGIAVLVLGSSGSGKSTSMRNLPADYVEILNVAGKPLPFRGQLPTVQHATYDDIHKAFKRDGKPIYIVDDSQYLMAFESFDKANEKGYDKFVHMAVHFKEMMSDWIAELPDETIVYFLHHTEIGEDSRVKPKTLGKMLDSQLVLEGLFSIVILAWCEAGNHFFVTNSDGSNCCKTPMGMFESETIDNDLALVDKTIREYYGWSPLDAGKNPEKASPPQKKNKTSKKDSTPAAPATTVSVEQPKEDTSVSIEDLNAVDTSENLLKPVDPADLEGLPSNLAELMARDHISPIYIQSYVADPDRGWYPMETPLTNYDPDLLGEYLPSVWNDVVNYAKDHTYKAPF